MLIKLILAGLIASFSPVLAHAQVATPTPNAQFILQVSSNLGCQTLAIELQSVNGTHTAKLDYDSNAFSAVTLPAGEYMFGQVICQNGPHGTEQFDTLNLMTARLSLQPGQAYLSGKLIVMETQETPTQSLPDIVDNCIRGTSRFRKEARDDCRDGAGIRGDRDMARSVNFYAPKMTQAEIDAVRSAFAATAAQLVYLPIETG